MSQKLPSGTFLLLAETEKVVRNAWSIARHSRSISHTSSASWLSNQQGRGNCTPEPHRLTVGVSGLACIYARTDACEAATKTGMGVKSLKV